ncbi:Mitochondrial acidic protein mam33 [Saxophila tyrrhenica]|uniref:Mitochondrial acidic protein mam33 n=1 Tax=Saxophila tyrrhenica TaxID=1690608 RepID=A0AAV9PGI6_9PEZI|nr:Mitochondrial acidic protein mam33 [Saxophila tyrrhenica]
MLSLRAFARRAPRSASQLAGYTTRSSIRPATETFAKPSSVFSARYQPLKAFSTSASRFDDAGQELAAKLEGEINIESENSESSTDSDSNVKTFFDQNSFWSVEDKSGEQDVFLTRSYDDENITVSFSIADFNSPSMMPEDEADEAFMDEDEDVETPQSGGANTKGAVNQGRTSGGNVKVAPEDSIAPADRDELRNDEDDDYSQNQAFPAKVNVLIQRSGKDGALRFHLVTDGSGFTIDNVTHMPTTTSSAAELLRDTPETVYTGPPFQQLDEEVQMLMQNYLEKRGFDTSLAAFIPDYIDVKEQREYLSWLGRMKGFVE